MPFCKFCKDAGKTQVEFTSHYPKDKPGKDGNVVCPTILNNECRYCHTKGHAKSHCPVLKEKNSRKRMTSVPQRFHRRAPQTASNNLSGWAMAAIKDEKCHPSLISQAVKNTPRQNVFSALEEDDQPKKIVALPKVSKAKAATGCWSVTPDLSNEAIQQKLASHKQELAVEEQAQDRHNMTPLVSIKEMNRGMVSWADGYDSEEDSEEDEEPETDFFGRPTTDNSSW